MSRQPEETSPLAIAHNRTQYKQEQNIPALPHQEYRLRVSKGLKKPQSVEDDDDAVTVTERFCYVANYITKDQLQLVFVRNKSTVRHKSFHQFHERSFFFGGTSIVLL